jgi:putative transcriptional regulator
MKTVAHRSLAPGFLIASPPLGDPNFDRTVVLLAVHDGDGALGFVVNRPAPMSLGEVLSLAGYEDVEVKDGSPVFIGGPVTPSMGWILCRDPDLDPTQDGVIAVTDRVRITSLRTVFDEMVRERLEAPNTPDPKRRTVVLGYSGWGPGQLEQEIAAGSWLPVPLDEAVLFDVEVEKRWEKAYALLGLTPGAMMSMRGGGAA